jgi:hypothetical protein
MDYVLIYCLVSAIIIMAWLFRLIGKENNKLNKQNEQLRRDIEQIKKQSNEQRIF